MKLLVAAIFAVLAVSAFADEWEIDWENVVPVQDMPGFWDGREIGAFFKTQDPRTRGRIVGGAVVTPGAHPYQAGLLMQFGGGTGLCGGSMIDSRTVLTAAHCPIGSSSTVVVMGAHQITTTEAVQQRRTVTSANYRLHASYNPSNLNNDIAILITPTPAVPTSARIGWSALPPVGHTATFAGITAQVSGWGRISDGSSATSPTLRSVTNPIITNAVCAQTYGTSVIIASTICLSTAGGRGTCNGDSGGPLTVPQAGQGPTGRWQVGVVSFGASAGCQQGFPAGFARVTSFRTWIQNNRF